MTATPVRFICVDDDPLALDQARMVIAKCDLPLAAEYFGSPKQALAAHREAPADLVLSDLRMGSTTGLDLIAEMRASGSNTIYMLLSGEADLESALKAVNEAGVFRFFTKPASLEPIKLGLMEAIRELNLEKMRKVAGTTMTAIEKMNAAIACVDIDGNIQFANEPANAIFETSGYFRNGPDGEIRSVTPSETSDFRAFLKSVAETGEDGPKRSVFRFSHPEQQEPIVVSAIPAENAPTQISLIIADPHRPVSTPAEIATALNLTPSESRVVHGLVSGGNVEEAAKSAGVSVSSARTYLKNVFAKTGVSRQAELVRLVLMAAA